MEIRPCSTQMVSSPDAASVGLAPMRAKPWSTIVKVLANPTIAARSPGRHGLDPGARRVRRRVDDSVAEVMVASIRDMRRLCRPTRNLASLTASGSVAEIGLCHDRPNVSIWFGTAPPRPRAARPIDRRTFFRHGRRGYRSSRFSSSSGLDAMAGASFDRGPANPAQDGDARASSSVNSENEPRKVGISDEVADVGLGGVGVGRSSLPHPPAAEPGPQDPCRSTQRGSMRWLVRSSARVLRTRLG